MQYSLLNLFRFLAALMVVLHHFAYTIPPFDYGTLNNILGNGHFAVTFFFVLSGFVMVISNKKVDFSKKEERIRFWKKRAIRLLPIYYLALFAFLFFEFKVEHPIDTNELLLNISGLQAWSFNATPILNPPAWSLSAEFFFYLVTPLLLLAFQKMTDRNRLILSFGIWLITITIFWILVAPLAVEKPSFNFFPLMHIASFISGIYIGAKWISIEDPPTFEIKKAILLVVSLLTILCVFNTVFFHKRHIDILTPAFAILILTVVQWEASTKIKLPTNLFNFLGDLSYPLYIFHWPFTLYYNYFVTPEDTLSWLFLYLGSLIIFCILINQTVERFFKKLYNRT